MICCHLLSDISQLHVASEISLRIWQFIMLILLRHWVRGVIQLWKGTLNTWCLTKFLTISCQFDACGATDAKSSCFGSVDWFGFGLARMYADLTPSPQHHRYHIYSIKVHWSYDAEKSADLHLRFGLAHMLKVFVSHMILIRHQAHGVRIAIDVTGYYFKDWPRKILCWTSAWSYCFSQLKLVYLKKLHIL